MARSLFSHSSFYHNAWGMSIEAKDEGRKMKDEDGTMSDERPMARGGPADPQVAGL